MYTRRLQSLAYIITIAALLLFAQDKSAAADQGRVEAALDVYGYKGRPTLKVKTEED